MEIQTTFKELPKKLETFDFSPETPVQRKESGTAQIFSRSF